MDCILPLLSPADMMVAMPHGTGHHVQERAICKIVELMAKHISQEPRTLFVMGSYRIGKERAYLGAAKAMGFRCHVNADKLRVGHVARPVIGFMICHLLAHISRRRKLRWKCCFLSTSALQL